MILNLSVVCEWCLTYIKLHSIITNSEVIILAKTKISGFFVMMWLTTALKQCSSLLTSWFLSSSSRKINGGLKVKTHKRISWEICYIETESSSEMPTYLHLTYIKPLWINLCNVMLNCFPDSALKDGKSSNKLNIVKISKLAGLIITTRAT